MKRVLIVGFTANPGGIENVVMNYYRNIDRNSIQFDFLYSTDTIAFEDEIKHLGGNVYHIASKKKNFFKYKKDIKTFFKKNGHKYSAVWVNFCNITNLDYLRFAKKCNISIRIMHCHNSQNMASFISLVLHKINKKLLTLYATHYWSCNDDASKWFYSKRIINSKNYAIINNAIPVKLYKYDSKKHSEMRKKLDLTDKLVIGNVGRLHFQKNQMFLIDVFYEIYKMNKNSILLLVGDGEDREKLLSKAQSLGIADNVKFLGIRNDVCDILQAIDVFVFPSLFEGLALSLIEAQASGLPIFASNTVSVKSKLSDCFYFLSLDDSAEAWAEYILNTYKELPLREKRKNIIKESHYDIEEEAKKMYSFFMQGEVNESK